MSLNNEIFFYHEDTETRKYTEFSVILSVTVSEPAPMKEGWLKCTFFSRIYFIFFIHYPSYNFQSIGSFPLLIKKVLVFEK